MTRAIARASEPASRRYTIGDMHAVASARGGACLAQDYVNLRTPLDWRCAHGHQWTAEPDAVLGGTWCPRCAGRLDAPLVTMAELARARGGACLSTRYVNPKTALRWRCQHGHVWSAPSATVLAGGWCRKCSLPTLDQLRALARQRGGECLARAVERKTTPLTWRCSSGHEWDAPPARVLAGSWCRTCANEAQRRQPKPRIGLALALALAHERGGLCLSTSCAGASAILEWQCTQGHTWTAPLRGVRRGLWCPECQAQAEGRTIAHMQELARARGGRCMSPRYLGCETRLRWTCERGHEWEASPRKLRDGTWCPHCAHNRPDSLASLKALAGERGGACLSTTYERGQEKLQWQCAAGHRWDATATAVRAGRWCPTCANALRGRPCVRLERSMNAAAASPSRI